MQTSPNTRGGATIKPLTLADLPLMMRIQEQQYQRQLDLTPALPGFDRRAADIESSLAQLIERHPAVGPFSGQDLLAYMTARAGIEHMNGSRPGAHTPEWAHGLRDGESVTLYQPLMAALWELWPADSCTHSLSYLSCQHDVRDFCFDMSYGKYVEDGIAVPGARNTHRDGDNREVRRATGHDLDQLCQWERYLAIHLSGNPIFRYSPPDPDQPPPGPDSSWLGSNVITLVAEQNGRLAGALRALIGETTNSAWVRCHTNVAINFIWVEPELRGLGIGDDLVEALNTAANTLAAASCSVDYETANTGARLFWRRHFDVFCESVIRKVDDRLRL